MSKNVPQTICELRLRLSGLSALIDSVDKNLDQMFSNDPYFAKATALLVVALREVSETGSVLDSLEQQIRTLDLDFDD